MSDPKKTLQRPPRDEKETQLQFPWFPRDGEPVRRKIPAWVFEHLRKQRSPEPFIRFRFVCIRDRAFGFEFPDYPDLALAYLRLEAAAAGDWEEG